MSLARDTIHMTSRRTVPTERTGADGFEGRVPHGAYDITTEALARRLYVERLRASIHRCDEGAIT